MGKIFGWSSSGGWQDTSDSLRQIFGAEAGRGLPEDHYATGNGFGVSVAECTAYSSAVNSGSLIAAITGLYRWSDKEVRRVFERDGPAEALIEAYRRHEDDVTSLISGSFVLAISDIRSGKLFLAVDRFSTEKLAYATIGSTLLFGTDTSLLQRHPLWHGDLDADALMSYMFFHNVPLPKTMYKNARRVPPGHNVTWDGSTAREKAYFLPDLDNYTTVTGGPDRNAELLDCLSAEIDYLSTGASVGAFLSGGLDSSTVTALLTKTRGQCHTFSIGFDESRYDELGFARLVAEHFESEHHEYYVKPEDIIKAAPRIAASFAEPFGNASAIPTYYCAKLAKESGVDRLLAGDGGDELFGGNERYAFDRYFQVYESVPAPLRRVLETIFTAGPQGKILEQTRPAKYLRKANIPLPDRLYEDSFLATIGASHIFDSRFSETVDHNWPLELIRRQYALARSKEPLNKHLALDWYFVLACSDLPKVSTTCELAGVEVGFPFLGNPVVEFSTKLPVDDKVDGSELRVFFRQAVSKLLPKQTLRKSKHGFGLPYGVWLSSHGSLREFSFDTLSDLKKREIVSPDFIDRLIGKLHPQHPQYYGVMVWLLLMLELFFVAKEARQNTD